jgi:hypothetical protein
MAVQPPVLTNHSPLMPPPMASGGRPMPAPPQMPPGAARAGALPPGTVPPPGQPGGQGGPPDDMGVPPLGFFQQPWVQNLLPFVTSLVAHAVIIIMAATVFAVATGAINVKQILHEEQTVIPESTSADQGPVGGVPNVGTNDDPTRKMMQDTTPDAGTPDGNSSKAGPTVDPSAEGGGQGDAAAADLLQAGGPGGSNGKGFGVGSGNGSSGAGVGQGGPLAMFGTPGGGAMGPKGPVFGHGGNARRIVFVCDASGSMINKFSSLKRELEKAVNNLRIPQSFDIVFFQDGKATVLSKDRLKMESLVLATPDFKRGASAFLEDVTTTSTSDPMPGLTVAFARQPDLIYLLTDGDFPDNDAVLKKVKELNKPGANGKKAKINTIAFVNDKDTDVAFLKLLETIAADNGGTFIKVAENELQ